MLVDDKYFIIFSEYYDSMLDPVCVFDGDGTVVYCNESFSIITGISQIRFINKKATIFTSFISLGEQSLNFEKIQELSQNTGSSILKFETKKVLRGLGQVCVKKLNIEGFEHLYHFTLKDLTVEEDLVKTFRFELESRNKKIDEMNQLVDIFQKIRLLDQPSQIVNEFMTYLRSSSKFYAAANRINSEISVVYSDEQDLSVNKVLSDVKADIERFIAHNVVSKYQHHKSNIKSATDYYYWAIVPFKLSTDEMYAIFIFDSNEQMKKFSHQSAIILSEQLNLILNNLTLKELSYTDGLTKLKNNLYFRKKIDEVCQLHKTAQLVLFDVDFFKKVNDTYGHPGGDAVLVFLGEKIPQVMQKVNADYQQSTIARVGGEEFAIIIPDKDIDFAQNFAEALRSEIEASVINFNSIEIRFTISLGISSWTPDHTFAPEAVKELYKAADDALYNSKRSGRNRVSTSKAA